MTARRVVCALHIGDPSGPSRSLAPVLAHLARDGEVTVAVPGPGRLAEEMAVIGNVVELGHEPLLLPRTPSALAALAPRLRSDARRFRALLRRERADLAIVATSGLAALLLAARLEGVPSIFYAAEIYGTDPFGGRLRATTGGAAVRLCARLADVTVACSHAVTAQLPGEVRTVVVYPVVDPHVATGDPDAFRARHGIPAGRPTLAMLGNITAGRGHAVAIRALEHVRADHPDAQLVVAGVPHRRRPDLEYAARVAALADRPPLRGAVHLCGFERAGDVYAAADVVVNPALFAESFGIVAAEALVAGRPVVSSAVGAVPEVLEDERHALLVPPGRPLALAAAVRRLLADRDLAERLAAQGRAHVRSAFAEERQLPRFERAIAMATDGR